MTDHKYVAWFRDNSLEPDDQDYEWPACFVIAASDSRAALAWGDRLASNYIRRSESLQFLRSYLDTDVWQNMEPRIIAGEEAPDEVIGW